MTEIVRRERRHAGRPAGSSERGAEPIGPNPWNTGRVSVRSSRATSPVTASNTTAGTLTHLARPDLETAAETRHRDCDSSTSPHRQRLELADAHPGRVEHDRRELVRGREKPYDCLDVLGGRRLRLDLRLAGELHARITGRVRFHLREVEHLSERRERLSNRLALAASRVELRDERIDVPEGRCDTFSDGLSDWGGFDRDAAIDDFEWLAGTSGPRGNDRRVLLAFREPDGTQHVFSIGAPTAREIAAELAARADAEAPPRPPWN